MCPPQEQTAWDANACVCVCVCWRTNTHTAAAAALVFVVLPSALRRSMRSYAVTSPLVSERWRRRVGLNSCLQVSQTNEMVITVSCMDLYLQVGPRLVLENGARKRVGLKSPALCKDLHEQDLNNG